MAFLRALPSLLSIPQLRLRASSILLGVSSLGIIAFGIFFRLSEVGSIPGINGDEALMTVQVQEMVAGRPTVLKMPTGRMLSPVYGVVLLVTENVLKTSFWTLRAPAFLSGILLLFLSFYYLRSVLGLTSALLTTLWIAVMPVVIAYSRIGIEQCLVPLSTLFVLLAALQGNWKQLFLAFVVALMVHPVNVFLVPVLFGPIAARVLTSQKWNRYQKQTFLTASTLILYLGILFEVFYLPAHYAELVGLPRMWERFLDPRMGFFFGIQFVRLLSGLTAYEQYVQAIPSSLALAWDVFFGFGMLLIIGFGTYFLQKKRDWVRLGLIVGWLTMVFGFYLTTGLNAIMPGVSRYALFLLVPSALSLSILLEACFQKRQRGLWIGFSVFCWVTLLMFSVFYFSEFSRINSTAHRTYESGPVEPKEKAWKWIQQDFGTTGPVVLAEDWWTYWPIRYLSYQDPRADVLYYLTPQDDIQHFPMRREVKTLTQVKELFERGGYAVGFPGGPLSHALASLYPVSRIYEEPIQGFGNRKVLSVFRLKR